MNDEAYRMFNYQCSMREAIGKVKPVMPSAAGDQHLPLI